MNICTSELAAVGAAPLSVMFFEAPRRGSELRPVAPIRVERPTAPEHRADPGGKQARLAFAAGTVALVMWGALLYILAANLQPPSLL